MHVKAKRAAVELRHTIIDKVDQLRRETRLLDRLAQGQHRLVGVRINVPVSKSLLHQNLLLLAAPVVGAAPSHAGTERSNEGETHGKTTVGRRGSRSDPFWSDPPRSRAIFQDRQLSMAQCQRNTEWPLHPS